MAIHDIDRNTHPMHWSAFNDEAGTAEQQACHACPYGNGRVDLDGDPFDVMYDTVEKQLAQCLDKCPECPQWLAFQATL